MHYKLYIDDRYSYETANSLFAELSKIIQKHENIDFKKYPEPLVQVGNSVILLNSNWGAKRPEVDDIEELSANHPDITFFLLQISNVINEHHFEKLGNYSLSEYSKGSLVRISNAKPVEWETVREFRRINPWG